MAPKGPKNPERSFGLSVGTVLLLIAGFAFWRNRITVAEWTGAVGAVLVFFGALAPSALFWNVALITGGAGVLSGVLAPLIKKLIRGID